MIIILSSAKTQAVPPSFNLRGHQPPLLERTQMLVNRCLELSKNDIVTIMKVSDKLAESTWQRFQEFNFPHKSPQAAPALITFGGTVFSEIKHLGYTTEDFSFAHQRLRILSGLYGLLRPLDLMQPYRLEMGMKIGLGQAGNLYDFWSDSITDQLNKDLKQADSELLINCASKEYSRAVQTKELKGTMLNMAFKQQKNGTIKTIAVYAKKARGMFVDWFLINRISDTDQLKKFDRGGYRFFPELSNDREFVFVTKLQ